MKAMIFAAGLGTRLYPITESIPKAMVEVGGKPMLGRVIEKLKAADITEIVINVHHFADKIEDYLRSQSNFGLNITVSDERDLLLDTGGGVRKATSLLRGPEPILLHNADILTDFDLKSMLAFHKRTKADATLMVSERTSSRYLLFDFENRMRGWQNTKTGEVRPSAIDPSSLLPRAFGGVHIISNQVLDRLEEYRPGEKKFSITPFYIDACRDLSITGYEPEETSRWFDIGKPETLEQARNCFQ